MTTLRFALLAIGLASLALLAACKRDDIRSYSTPKEPSSATAAASADAPRSEPTASVTWTLPDGWKEIQTDEPMRIATIQAADQQVLISAFPGDVGGLVANVNRWRGQLGLQPADEAQILASLKTESIEGVKVSNLRIVGDSGSDMLAAIINPGDGKTWFVKCTAPAAAATSLEAQFVAFTRTFRLGGQPRQPAPAPAATPAPASLPADHPPVATPPAANLPSDHPPIDNAGELPSQPRNRADSAVLSRATSWSAPANWKATPDPSGIAVAAFELGTPATRVTLTSLLGDGGGVLSNVNRWRGQVGLAPVAAITEQPSTDLGEGALLVSLKSPDGTKGISAAIISEGQQTWFFKLTGDAASLDSAATEFGRFVREVGRGEGKR